MNIPCPSKIDTCLPCDDDPILNISAEDQDTDPFLFNFNNRTRPRLGFTFENVGCKRKCTSEVSQFEADLCAVLQVTECINDGFRDETGPTVGTEPPFPVPQPPALFFNSAQTCTTFCADGTSFGFTLAAGRVAADNQVQANRIAFSLACRRSAQLRVCIRTTSLPMACRDSFYEKQLLGSGGTPFRVTFDNFSALSALCAPATSFPNSVFPYVWSATGLPNGLSITPCSGVISGTPTEGGSFSVTIRAQDSLGAFQTKTLTLNVVDITTNSALPDATVGCAYSETLAIGPADTYAWSLSDSSLGWLSINPSTGELSGTPDATGSFAFTVSVEGSSGGICSKDFTLTVGEGVDLGTVTPSILAGTLSFFDSGNPQPPGRYRIRYETGAMQYAACFPDPCWSVNTVGAGFRYVYFAGHGPPGELFPALETVFLTQAAAEAANAGLYVDFDTTISAAISMRLGDTNYADNQAGAPNPTFRLFRLCLA